MLYEIPPTSPGAAPEYAVRCDVPDCDLEVAGATQEEALDNASLVGFKFEQGGPRHACIECQRGTSDAMVKAKTRLQQAMQQAAAQAEQHGGEPEEPADPTGWLN